MLATRATVTPKRAAGCASPPPNLRAALGILTQLPCRQPKPPSNDHPQSTNNPSIIQSINHPIHQSSNPSIIIHQS
jgi:hypothetical protein